MIARIGTFALCLLAAAADGDERAGAELIAAQVSALESSLILLEAPDRDMPLAVRIDASSIELVDDRLGWSQVVDALALQPRVRASFRAPAQPGAYEVRASVEYWVCGERWCRRKYGELSWSVVVEGSA